MNARLTIVLLALAAVVASALGAVHARHESRRHAVELGMLEHQSAVLTPAGTFD